MWDSLTCQTDLLQSPAMPERGTVSIGPDVVPPLRNTSASAPCWITKHDRATQQLLHAPAPRGVRH